MEKLFANDRKESIKKILYGYVNEDSISNTKKEKQAEKYFIDYFSSQKYFQENPEYMGAFPIENDALKRSVSWAMVRGNGTKTVVMIHHNDVVTVEDYKSLKNFAFQPDVLYEKLGAIKDSFSEEARKDYESGDYLFGRGVCDMKGGGSIQMQLLTEYSLEDFNGNVIVLGLPDEENLSVGMRTAVLLLKKLKAKYSLDYVLMINSEPHQRRNPEEGVFSFGSIGKVMPYIYVRGFLAHAGKVFEGFNPVNVMAEIVRETEVNVELSDVMGKEVAPPPTWLYLRENKLSYDVSMPLSISGCLSVLTFTQTPKSVLDKVKTICKKSFDRVIEDMNSNYTKYMQHGGSNSAMLSWKSNVVFFGELCSEAREKYGDDFQAKYEEYLEKISDDIFHERETYISANYKLIEFVYDYIDDMSPRVVIALAPPYYPNVTNKFHEGEENQLSNLYDVMSGFVQRTFGQKYVAENIYTGISDLSYSSVYNYEETLEGLRQAMPLFGKAYNLPIAEINEIAMPCVNVGPWGKDFHKLTERVYKPDLYYRTPQILDYVIRAILKSGEIV